MLPVETLNQIIANAVAAAGASVPLRSERATLLVCTDGSPMSETVLPAAADFAPIDRQAVRRAVFDIHLFIQILMIADAHIRLIGTDENDSVGRFGRQGIRRRVIDHLRTQRRKQTKIEQANLFFHFHSSRRMLNPYSAYNSD